MDTSELEPGTYVVITRHKQCDFCKNMGEVVDAVIDGKTSFGPWANMCQPHFDLYGVGLGTGFGQRLIIQPAGEGDSDG